ncbi:MAG TPA: hypothetical protein VND92_09495 [Vicinamibacterales bacterium]|nr:hypothetical protein [Vicinamibacterales bacterium]
MRTFMKAAGIAAAALLVLTVAAPRARADEANELTYITFSAPVSLPGVSLPAGTYQFRRTGTDDHIVQIFSRSGNEIYATLITIPEVRYAPAPRTIVTFHETPAGTPEAIKAWFYPGRQTGNEFLYARPWGQLFASRGHGTFARQG